MKKVFSFVDPYELPEDTQMLHDIEDLTNCTCPRVFYPACGEDGETYFNACVLKCIGLTKMRRRGPCISFRRMDSMFLNLKIPFVWRDPDAAFLEPDNKLEDVSFGVPIVTIK